MPDPNATLQPDATAAVPQVDQTSAPITGRLQPPVAAPAASAPVTLAAGGTPPVTVTSPNKNMHSLISRVLGAFAGPAPATYTATPEGKVVSAPTQRPDTNASKV